MTIPADLMRTVCHAQASESTHLICNPEGGHQLIKNVTRAKTRGGYVVEWEITMGIFSGGVSAVREGVEEDEADDVGRVLLQHAIQPEICDSIVEWAAAGKETAGETAAAGELWIVIDSTGGGSMGGGRISMVGTAEGGAAAVAAVDSETISPGWSDRKEAVEHQSGNDGPASEIEEGIDQKKAVRKDAARGPAEAPDSDQDRLVECEGAGIC